MNTVFIKEKLTEQDKSFFKLLGKKTDILVAYYSGKRISKPGFPVLFLKKQKKAYSNIVKLEQAIKSTRVVIPHTALPTAIKKVISKNVSPQNLIIWSKYAKTILPHQKLKSYWVKMGYFFRALRSNLVIAQSKPTKEALSSLGFPMAGQKLKVISRSIGTKKELAILNKPGKKQKKDTLIFGVLNTFTDSLTDIENTLLGITYYSDLNARFLISSPELDEGRIKDKVKVDERISFVTPISGNRKKLLKFLSQIDILICPSTSPDWSSIIQTAHAMGIPVIASNLIPNIATQQSTFKDLILTNVSPIHIAKAIAKTMIAIDNQKEYRASKISLMNVAHKNTIENEVEKWLKVLG